MLNGQVERVSKAISKELHDLAQPITSLQFRLEIGMGLGGEEALLDAAKGGLDDLHRITEALVRLRQVVAEINLEQAA